MARKGLTDGIDLVGHPSRQALAVTTRYEVDKPLNSFKGVETSKTRLTLWLKTR